MPLVSSEALNVLTEQVPEEALRTFFAAKPADASFPAFFGLDLVPHVVDLAGDRTVLARHGLGVGATLGLAVKQSFFSAFYRAYLGSHHLVASNITRLMRGDVILVVNDVRVMSVDRINRVFLEAATTCMGAKAPRAMLVMLVLRCGAPHLIAAATAAASPSPAAGGSGSRVTSGVSLAAAGSGSLSRAMEALRAPGGAAGASGRASTTATASASASGRPLAAAAYGGEAAATTAAATAPHLRGLSGGGAGRPGTLGDWR